MEASPNRPPAWYWIIATIACLVMFAQLMNLIVSPVIRSNVGELTIAQDDVAPRAMWFFVLMCLTALTGFVGAAGLMLREPWAKTFLGVAVAFAAIQFIGAFFVQDNFALLALPVSGALYWFSHVVGIQDWYRGPIFHR